MGQVFFISDLHIGHTRILEFSAGLRGGTTIEEHNEWLVTQWNSVVSKNDVVYVLGDVLFGSTDGFKYLKAMKGQKNLILGNHDEKGLDTYKQHFNSVHGFRKKYGFWLSHAPVHPNELRGSKNIHGHVHAKSIDDSRYVNVCVEALRGVPLSLDTIRRFEAVP